MPKMLILICLTRWKIVIISNSLLEFNQMGYEANKVETSVQAGVIIQLIHEI